jgi:hypothetical protein
MSGNWKTNTGCSMVEEPEPTDTYRLQAEEPGTMFGGVDIGTVDVLYENGSGVQSGGRRHLI